MANTLRPCSLHPGYVFEFTKSHSSLFIGLQRDMHYPLEVTMLELKTYRSAIARFCIAAE